MIRAILTLLILAAGPDAAAQWLPDPGDRRQVRAAAALERFSARSRLAPYFAEATGYAVFPSIIRFGVGTGFAHGRGIVIEADQMTGVATMWEFVHGIWAGAEVHRTIIFFQNEQALEDFKQHPWKFQGRAGAALTVVGGSVEPAFNHGVAIFSETRAGLLVEAAVGAARYKFRAVP